MLTGLICVCLLALASTNGENRASPETGEVAFSAGLTNMLSLSHTERVKYDRLFTNIGGGYHSDTGTFVCPTAGIYVFQFHSVAHQIYYDDQYLESSTNNGDMTISPTPT